MNAPRVPPAGKLLGGFPFISRTFEGKFKENPYVLDADANLFIGPADNVSRDEHVAIEVIYHFLAQTGRAVGPFRELLRDREKLLRSFAVVDGIRSEEGGPEEFNLHLFGTYDGEPLQGWHDDELPAGPCGKSVNELKRRLYEICMRMDKQFSERSLSAELREIEARFIAH
jgi:hypothetical protein